MAAAEQAAHLRAQLRGMSRGTLVVLTRWASVIVLLLLWEVGARLFGNPLFISPPSRIIQAFFDTIVVDPRITAAIGLTVFEVAVAYFLALVFGLAIGMAVGWTRFSRASLFPIVLLLYAIPQITLLPLFVMIFGLGPTTKIAFGFTHGIFPIVVNLVGGMRNLQDIYDRGARSMGATQMEIARHVVFPQVVPSLFAGLRLAMTMTVLGVILAELYVSTAGIGYFTRIFSETFDPAPLFALSITLAIIAIFFNESVRVVETRFARWRNLGT